MQEVRGMNMIKLQSSKEWHKLLCVWRSESTSFICFNPKKWVLACYVCRVGISNLAAMSSFQSMPVRLPLSWLFILLKYSKPWFRSSQCISYAVSFVLLFEGLLFRESDSISLTSKHLKDNLWKSASHKAVCLLFSEEFHFCDRWRTSLDLFLCFHS